MTLNYRPSTLGIVRGHFWYENGIDVRNDDKLRSIRNDVKLLSLRSRDRGLRLNVATPIVRDDSKLLAPHQEEEL